MKESNHYTALELYDAKKQLEMAEEILESQGYRRCDIPACNCNGYHRPTPPIDNRYVEDGCERFLSEAATEIVRDPLVQAVQKHLPLLKDMASQVLSPSDNSMSRMVKDFEQALGEHDDWKMEAYLQLPMQDDKIHVAREAILQELRRRWKKGPAPDLGVTAPSDISRFSKPQTNYFCGHGEMDCPLCKTGKLRYSRSNFNGHVMAQCSKGCVAWME